MGELTVQHLLVKIFFSGFCEIKFNTDPSLEKTIQAHGNRLKKDSENQMPGVEATPRANDALFAELHSSHCVCITQFTKDLKVEIVITHAKHPINSPNR